MAAIKKFSDMQPDEFISIVDPFDGTIKESKVLKSVPHPKSQNKQVWLLEIQNILKINLDQDTMDKASELHEDMSRQLLVDKDAHMCMTATKIPTVLATEKKYIIEWMEQTGPKKRA